MPVESTIALHAGADQWIKDCSSPISRQQSQFQFRRSRYELSAEFPRYLSTNRQAKPKKILEGKPESFRSSSRRRGNGPALEGNAEETRRRGMPHGHETIWTGGTGAVLVRAASAPVIHGRCATSLEAPPRRAGQ